MSDGEQVGETVYRALVERAPGPVLVVGDEGTVEYANGAVGEVLGHDPGSLVGEAVADLFAPSVPEPMAVVEREAGSDGELGDDCEVTLVDAAGEEVPAALAVRAVGDAETARYGLLLRDLTERVERDRALSELRDRYERIFQQTSDAIVVFDPRRETITDCNPRACELLGYDREELLALSPGAVHPDELDRFRSFVASVVAEGHSWTDELNCRTKAGETVPAEVSASTVELDDRVQVLAAIRDVSARRRHRRRLEGLADASRRLTAAEDEDAVAAVTAEVVEEVLDRPFALVWLRTDADRLTVAAGTAAALEEGSDDAEGADTALDARVLDSPGSGEPGRLADCEPLAEADWPGSQPEQALVVPLGDQGLLLAGGEDPFDDRERDILETLGRNAGTALEQLERERTLRRQSTAMDAALDSIAITDGSAGAGEFVYVNEAFAATHGYDDPEALVGGPWTQVYGDDQVDRFEWDVLPTVREEGQWRGEVLGRRADGSSFPQALTVARIDGGGLVWVLRDVTDRRDRRQRLEALNETTRALIGDSDENAVAETALTAVDRVLGHDAACVRLYDAEADDLDRVATTGAGDQLLAERTAYDMEATLAGRAFREGETVLDQSGPDDPYGTGDLASLHVPLGEHGVVTVVTDAGEGFDDRTVRLAELLAGNVRSALSRVRRQRQLHERERQLRAHRDQLETLDRINALVREVIASIVESGSRAAIERTVCERLVASDFYRAAWTGTLDDGDEAVLARITAADDGPVPPSDSAVDEGWVGGATALAAARDDEVAVGGGDDEVAVGGGDDEVAVGGGNDRADEGRDEAIVAAPLSYADRSFGVLVVHAATAGAFQERAVEGFEVLGRVVAFAINAARSRELLLSDTVLEIECVIEGVFADLSGRLDSRFVHEGDSRTGDGRVLHYVRAEGVDPDEVVDHLEAADRVRQVRVIHSEGRACRLEVDIEESPPELLVQSGTNIRSIVAEHGRSKLLVEAPPTVDVRRLLDALDRRYAGVELVARREVDRSFRTRREFTEAVQDGLTDRQRTALRTAYRRGYYEWPRDSTAEEVAAALDISSSTLHQHLRRAEAELMATFFEDRG